MTRAADAVQPIWIGTLDLDGDVPVAPLSGPLRADHGEARVLARFHSAPIGFVQVAAAPAEALTDRVRTQAETMLAAQLRRHAELDMATTESPAVVGEEPAGSLAWAASVVCPRRFPARGEGVSIVICSRDRADVLRNCLRSLRDVSYDPLEILIVDNAPTSNATWEVVAEAAKDDPRVDYTCEPRPGLSMARNHGLAKAKFDQVAFTDDDILIDRGWPAAIAAGFASDPKVTCVTGPIAASALESSAQLYFDTRISWSEVFEPRRYDLTQHRHPSPLYPFQAGVLGTGANIAVRRRALDRIGLFDPLLGTGGPGRGGEDLDFLLRVILGGGRVCYLPSAILWHLYRDDAQPLDGQLYSYGHGLGAYLAKHASNKDMRAALVRHGLRQARTVATRMRQASHVSGPQHGGGRLALSEVRGVAMGALHYWQAARRRPNLPQE